MDFYAEILAFTLRKVENESACAKVIFHSNLFYFFKPTCQILRHTYLTASVVFLAFFLSTHHSLLASTFTFERSVNVIATLKTN